MTIGRVGLQRDVRANTRIVINIVYRGPGFELSAARNEDPIITRCAAMRRFRVLFA